MRKMVHLMFFTVFTLLACNTERVLFEKETWWIGHWQSVQDSSLYFSIGQKPVGANEIVTTQFFVSRLDSIHANFYVKELVDFNHKRRWKIIKTSNDAYLKIKELDESQIALFGPYDSLEELDSEARLYKKKPEYLPPPIADSLLFMY